MAQPIPACAGACLFSMFAPLEGWRHVDVTERRTAIDYAQALKDLADVHFPNAKKISPVQDNLNTHTEASLYETLPAPEARRLARSASRSIARPSTADGSIPAFAGTCMAEFELGALSSQCLDRRIPEKEMPIEDRRRLASRSQHKPHRGRLALRNRRRPHQAEADLPAV